jgi:hypothetical protein
MVQILTITYYELVAGELIVKSFGTGRHGKIIKFVDDTLNQAIPQAGLAWISQRFTVGVQSPRGDRWDTYPLRARLRSLSGYRLSRERSHYSPNLSNPHFDRRTDTSG